MSVISASAFTVWVDWLNKIQADMLTQLKSAAIRHSKMSGAASSTTLFWFRTGPHGTESGLFASMEHGGSVHSTSNVGELVNSLKSLPADVQEKIVEGFTPASGIAL